MRVLSAAFWVWGGLGVLAVWVWSSFGIPELWPKTGGAPNVYKTHNQPRNRNWRPGQEARHMNIYRVGEWERERER